MAIGGPGGGSRDDDLGLEESGGFNDINITPLTDIFLVLLIIFMVTSSVIVNSSNGAKAGLKVNLPQGGAADVATRPAICRSRSSKMAGWCWAATW